MNKNQLERRHRKGTETTTTTTTNTDATEATNFVCTFGTKHKLIRKMFL
jgi:hypothetical protein